MNDARSFDIKRFLRHLNFIGNPNGENIEKVREYNQIMVSLYEKGDDISLNDYIEMWHKLGIGDELGRKLESTLRNFLEEEVLIGKVGECYKQMLQAGLNFEI